MLLQRTIRSLARADSLSTEASLVDKISWSEWWAAVHRDFPDASKEDGGENSKLC